MTEQPKKRLTTHGELRQFMADTILGIKNGHVDAETARSMISAMSQITENLYSEIKASRLEKDLGRVARELGSLPIGADEP